MVDELTEVDEPGGDRGVEPDVAVLDVGERRLAVVHADREAAEQRVRRAVRGQLLEHQAEAGLLGPVLHGDVQAPQHLPVRALAGPRAGEGLDAVADAGDPADQPGGQQPGEGGGEERPSTHRACGGRPRSGRPVSSPRTERDLRLPTAERTPDVVGAAVHPRPPPMNPGTRLRQPPLGPQPQTEGVAPPPDAGFRRCRPGCRRRRGRPSEASGTGGAARHQAAHALSGPSVVWSVRQRGPLVSAGPRAGDNVHRHR
ncbi:hypothetical protein SAMN05421756_10727 [Microlunatus flavus]|uniref:Uncharacterized protein n=1 Tax=Microlunatus flavus TaxID=1036181 RepID=A0A1H9K104_9ACTN|nr:hypothetical protein SAMN05421756_10727 [Microlunatus flavus]